MTTFAPWWKALGDVAGLYFQFFWVWVLSFLGRAVYTMQKDGWEKGSKHPPIAAYLRSIILIAAASAVFGWMAWSGYGTHTEDSDPLYGGGTVVDDFTPTGRERDNHGAWVVVFWFLTLGGGATFQFWPDAQKLRHARREGKEKAELERILAEMGSNADDR